MKLFISLIALTISANLCADNRLKDIATIKGVRDNPLIGYGLVIGLNGTGDNGGEITNNSLRKMFTTLGLDPAQEVGSANVASVIVTAKLPAFARSGQEIDVTISSIGDANSLAGGTLLVTPLKGGDGNVYAIASGAL
ncbi:MAG: flagellar basal body P-ring protein FlgI, partial [Bacteriovoracaceae bacterium]